MSTDASNSPQPAPEATTPEEPVLSRTAVIEFCRMADALLRRSSEGTLVIMLAMDHNRGDVQVYTQGDLTHTPEALFRAAHAMGARLLETPSSSGASGVASGSPSNERPLILRPDVPVRKPR